MLSNSCLYVVGNGSGVPPTLDKDIPFVVFNQSASKPLRAGEIRINNRKFAGLDERSLPFVVRSRSLSVDDCEHLQDKLRTTSNWLCNQLGCLPSAGLATVFALTEMGMGLQLFQMPLRPSLVRVNTIPMRQPLAAAYHNWLGERRLAWQLLRMNPELLIWPQLYLQLDSAETVQDTSSLYFRLRQWFTSHANRSGKTDISTLQELAILPVRSWYPPPDIDTLQELETFFFLSRQQQATPNWWLYRNDMSTVIDTLLLRLMQVQQYLLAED